MAIGSKLKQLLNDRGITVKDFAQAIGVPPTTLYSFIQRDSQSANIDLLIKICEGLDISLKELLTVKEEIDGEIMNVIDLTGFDTEEQVNLALTEIKRNPSTKVINSQTGESQTFSPEIKTLAAHFKGDEFTEEELEEIRQFAEFVKSKRKKE